MSNTAEIREALELAMARIGCPPGDNADADIYHRLSRALALLADMEREGEPAKASAVEVAGLALDMTEAIWPRVKGIEQYELTNLAERCIYKGIELRKRHVTHPSPQPSVEEPWNDGDIEAAYLAGCINGASQEVTGKTYWPSLDRARAELQRLKDNGISIPSMIRSMRNKAHPSPTAADAKDSAVDVQEVIKCGDAMANRLKMTETGAGLQAVWSELTKQHRP